MIRKYFVAFLALVALALGGAPALAQTPKATGIISTQNLSSDGSCTSGGCVEIEVSNKGVLTVQVTGTYTAAGGLSAQVTSDEATWVTLAPAPFIPATALGSPTSVITSGATGIWQVPYVSGAVKFRITALGAVTGAAVVTLNTSPVSPASSTTISGGAGDASAANQLTGNASLASIDGKLSGGSQKTQIVDGSGNVIGATSNALDVNVKSGAATGVSQGSTTSGQAGSLIQAATTTSAPTYTTGTTNPLSTDTSGSLRVTVTNGGSGTVTQGSTTSGQSGMLTQGAVTTSAPTYTTGQTSPLSLDTAGNLRVSVQGGAGSTVTGTTAHDAGGSSVNPVLTGCYASAAAPTDVSADADAVRDWCLRNGARAVQPTYSGSLAATNAGAASSATPRTVTASDSPEVTTLGGTSDGASTAGGTGSVSAKLRLMTTQLDTINTSINASNSQLPAALGATTASASLSITPATNATFVLGTGSNTIGSLSANQSVNVSQISGVTPLMGAGNTGTGSPRVTIASDQAALPAHGLGAVGSAAPSGAQMAGARSGANMVGITQANASAAISINTATTTQLVALSSGQVIHVTAWDVVAGGTGNFQLVYGTGTNCGTGTTSLTGAYPLVANAGLTKGAGLGPVLVVPAGNALCATTSAAVQMSGSVAYTQYTP